jgi:hypothetical protein
MYVVIKNRIDELKENKKHHRPNDKILERPLQLPLSYHFQYILQWLPTSRATKSLRAHTMTATGALHHARGQGGRIYGSGRRLRRINLKSTILAEQFIAFTRNLPRTAKRTLHSPCLRHIAGSGGYRCRQRHSFGPGFQNLTLATLAPSTTVLQPKLSGIAKRAVHKGHAYVCTNFHTRKQILHSQVRSKEGTLYPIYICFLEATF